MMVRVIPRLDIKGPNLVKGVHMEGLRVVGKPEDFARLYYEAGADELIYQDVVASLYGRNSLLSMIERTSREIFIPLCVGGGLRSLEDIEAALKAGADKVALNTAAVTDPDLVSRAARRFGSSTIVAAIEAKRMPDGVWRAFTDSGREPTGLEVLPWAQRLAELGAGEILIASIDRDGTGQGFDLEITHAVSASVPIPVIASGGAGSVEDIRRAVDEGLADAVALASILHYHALEELRGRGDFTQEGNVDFLAQMRRFTKIESMDLATLKACLGPELVRTASPGHSCHA